MMRQGFSDGKMHLTGFEMISGKEAGILGRAMEWQWFAIGIGVLNGIFLYPMDTRGFRSVDIEALGW